MSIKIIADSCCDLNETLKKQLNMEIAPLTIQIEDKVFKDDENLDIVNFLKFMKNSKEAPKTACPAPSDFIKAFEGDDSIFVVTLSSALSGSYKSALIAKNIFIEDIKNKFIHVFDSLSASIGETLIALKISELVNKEYEESKIIDSINTYIKGMKTFFMLETLDNLAKAGRVSPIIAKLSSALSIRLIMTGTEEGNIKLHEKVIGVKKAFKRFVEIIGEQEIHFEERVLGIAHCNCLEKALEFKEEVMKRYKFKDIIIVKTAGISSVYANEGGIIIAF